MKNKKTKYTSQRNFRSGYTLISISVIAYVSCFIFSGIAYAQQRYQARSVNAQADQFLARANQPMINVDFIVAHTVNTVFHAIREGRELTNTVLLEDGNNAGSVVIGAGTDVGDLVIINDNEGDNIVVNR